MASVHLNLSADSKELLPDIPFNRVVVQSEPIRFWIEEYAFSEGETTLLRKQIEVE